MTNAASTASQASAGVGWGRVRATLTGPLVIYLFVTAVLALLAWQAVSGLLRQGELGPAGAVLVAGAGLVGAFWWNGVLGGRQRWWRGYVAVQSLLVVVLVAATRVVAHVDISMAESALLCLAGEALGTWGNTRRGFGLAGGYLGAAVASLMYFTPPDRWAAPLNQFGLIAATVVVLVVLLNRAEAERLRAEALAAELRASTLQVAALTRRAERQRMARELHDTLAQGLTGITLQLEAARAHLERDNVPRTLAIVDQAVAGARATLASSRQAIDDLRRNPDDLASEIGMRAARFTRDTGIRSSVEIGGEVALPGSTREHLLRILDEALANVAQHADAGQVLVQFSDGGDGLRLQVTDDGRGFAPDAVGSGHYGLLGMRERAGLIGGTLAVESQPGWTVVRLEVRE